MGPRRDSPALRKERRRPTTVALRIGAETTGADRKTGRGLGARAGPRVPDSLRGSHAAGGIRYGHAVCLPALETCRRDHARIAEPALSQEADSPPETEGR